MARPVTGTLRAVRSRVGNVLVVVAGVTALTFLLVNALPGNVAYAMLGDQATPERVAELTAQLGLDRPIWVRYAEWVGGALRGDLGASLVSAQPVWTAVLQRVPATLELLVLALVIAVVAAVPTACLAVRRPGGALDRALGTATFALLATPSFLVGLLLILVLAMQLKVFPPSGWVALGSDPVANLRSAMLPALALAASPYATYTRLLRADMLEQLTRQDYVVTARAKGVPPVRILLGHVLRNAVFPLMTMVGLTTSLLVGGSVVIETIFGVPGIGQLLIQSITARDVPVVLGSVVFIAVTVVLVNQLVDVLYGVVDPRTRYERADG